MCAKHAEEKAALGKYSLSMICTVYGQTSKNSKFLNFKTLKYDANFVVCLTFDFVKFLFLVHEVKSFTFNFSAAKQSHVDALMLTQSEKLEKLTKKHTKEIQSLDESHKAEITNLNEDHATHVVELENAKDQEQALIKAES